MIALTIEVKNSFNQSIEISVESKLQEIEIVNAPEQEIDITEQDGSQNINIENAPEQDIDVEQDIEIIKIYENASEYEGEYEVTPKFATQTLPTAEKVLTKDVTIEKIPYHEVSNNSGGTTVTIG